MKLLCLCKQCFTKTEPNWVPKANYYFFFVPLLISYICHHNCFQWCIIQGKEQCDFSFYLTNFEAMWFKICTIWISDIVPCFKSYVIINVVAGNVSSSTFDFTVLYKLIRNTITPLPPPTRGWGLLPSPGEITEEDDIERIRHHRNLLAHNTELKLNDLDFNTVWTDLSQVCKR